MTWLITLVLAVLSLLVAQASPVPAPATRPATCRAGSLSARQPGPGGGAGGTFYTTVMLTNEGEDCLLTTGSLTLWVGTRQRALLDLFDHHGVLELSPGASYQLWAIVPDDACSVAAHGAAVLGIGGRHAEEPLLRVTGSVVPAAYARCGGVQLIGAARRAAPSR